MKMRAVYSVSKRLRHVGHLDLMRLMHRALRRSGIPVAYSSGYNPHILLSLAAPLNVGMAGDREVMDVQLSEAITEQKFMQELNNSLPDGVRILSASKRDEKHPAAMSQLFAAQIRYDFLSPADSILSKVDIFMQRESIMSKRKSKKGMVEYDMRPLIYALSVKEGSLYALLSLSSKGTLKPASLIEELSSFAGVPLPQYIAVRTALYADKFIPLEEA